MHYLLKHISVHRHAANPSRADLHNRGRGWGVKYMQYVFKEFVGRIMQQNTVFVVFPRVASQAGNQNKYSLHV